MCLSNCCAIGFKCVDQSFFVVSEVLNSYLAREILAAQPKEDTVPFGSGIETSIGASLPETNIIDDHG